MTTQPTKIVSRLTLATLAGTMAASAFAQAATGADASKKDREQVQERARLERVDPPIKPDPVGNAIIGGIATGAVKGAAAGAISTVRGSAVGSAVQTAREDIAKNKAANERSGRGGAADPRYNPGTLVGR